MVITTLNLQHGGGRRITPIVEFLGVLNSDVLVLTEYHSDDRGLGKKLFELGYKSQVSGGNQPKENTVLIASKVAFEIFQSTQRICSVRLKEFLLFGVYFPQGEAKRPVFNQLKNGVNQAKLPTLVIGDFNTGIHYLDEAGKSFICSDSFKSLSDGDLVDSWRSRNIDEREFSWYSAQRNGFRIDHVFCSKSLDQKVLDVRYLHDPRVKKITDHSALSISLNL